MKRLGTILVAASLALAIGAAPADASFGLNSLNLTFSGADGSAATQAGSHPFAQTSSLGVNTVKSGEFGFEIPDGDLKDLRIEFPPGFVADRNATLRCSTLDFLARPRPICPNGSAVGVIDAAVDSPDGIERAPIFNLVPPPGMLAKFGFSVLQVPVTIEVGLNPNPPYNGFAQLIRIPQVIPFYSSVATIWGTPADPAHDSERAYCGAEGCAANTPERPFLTLPRSCTGPLPTIFEADSWQGALFEETVFGHGDGFAPSGMTGCGKLGFAPRIVSKPTTDQAESPSGLDFNLDIDDEGLTNNDGIASSDIKKAVVTLPAGVTVNPSVAEGLGVCTKADYENETLASAPGEGCPQSSKIGTLEVESPLLEGELLTGQVFVAQQDDPATVEPGAENPFDSMIALYLVIKDPGLGIMVKQAGKVEPSDESGPNAGQLVTTFDEIPQVPFSHLRLHFREGGRSPLITPAGCGTFVTKAEFTPWANPDRPLSTTAPFAISKGVAGGPCPPPGAPPFKPVFQAGSLSNNAGAYSPFDMRVTRADGEQDITKFSAVLPPGVVAKLAGVSQCPEAAIASAKSKTGRQELAAPSCPANSRIGRTLAGAGAGSELTYVPGSLYLAGPYNGDPLSVVAITPAVAGPFDAGTVVVHVALTFNPDTGVGEVDGSRSDPIPHVLKGIVLKLRDLRVYADRPNFTINPTSCGHFQTRATLWGSFLDVFSPADDVPVSPVDRYQVANCANLGFKPKLAMTLTGGTQRGDHPAFSAVVTPRPGDANFAKAAVTLPRSAFLDQAHIRTICTRVQFAAGSCPPGAVYGTAKAWSPLVDEPLQGSVYLRSSNHKLPDLVAALHGIVDVNVVGRIDSHKGGIRGSFESIPDVPVSRFILNMRGGKKGLIVNSRGLCANPSHAIARLTGQNGKQLDFDPPVVPKNCKKRRAGH